MKHIYILTLVLLISMSLQATQDVFTKTNASWAATSSWSLSRIPVSNDTIVIPVGSTVNVYTTANLNGVVLQVNGSLVFSGGSLVLDANSKILLASGAYIKGTSNTEIIKIGSTIKFKGGQTSITGSSFADKTTGAAPVGFTSVILPVEFAGFYAVKNGNDIELSWTTAQETNNNNFEIQRSTDGSNWTVIASLKGAGNTNQLTAYQYTDKNINAATLYYRIHQVDYNGQSVFTSIKIVHSTGNNSTSKVFSTGKNINVEFNSPVNHSFSIRVINMNGQLVAQQNFQQSAYRIVMNLNQATSGAYVVQVMDGSGLAESTKLVL